MTVYAPGQAPNPGEFASILAIGDSWFWYPRNSLVHAIANHPNTKDPFRNIQLLGYNGAKLDEYVFGRYSKQLERELRPENFSYYSAVLISGAGNDAVDFGLALKRNCSRCRTAEDCLDPSSMGLLLARVSAALGSLIHQIWRAGSKRGSYPAIVLHTYDYPLPDGRGFDIKNLKVTGPWLKPSMDKRMVPEDSNLRTEICRLLIDRLSEEFLEFADPSRHIYLIDTRGTLVSKDHRRDWDNEMHPTSSGFERLADQHWIGMLRQLGMAS